MTFIVRMAEHRDLETVGRLGAMLIRLHYAFDPLRFIQPPPNAERAYASFLGGLLDSDDSCVFVAERENAIIGYVFAALEPWSWKELRGPAGFIHDIVVTESERRSGVATKLLETAFDWLRDHGAPRVLLGTASSNEGAKALFHRLGFRDTMIEMTMELNRT